MLTIICRVEDGRPRPSCPARIEHIGCANLTVQRIKVQRVLERIETPFGRIR